MKGYVVCSALAVFCFFTLFPLCYFPEVFQVSEAREGVVVQEIVRTGNYLLPLRHGTIVPSKPPLFHWLGSLASEIQEISPEFCLRFISLLAACCLVYFVSFFCFRLAGLNSAFLAVGLMLGSWSFVRLATDGRVDMLFVFLLSVSVLSWSRVQFAKGSSTLLLVSGLSAGLAVLAKGPLGVVLPGLVFFLAHCLSGRFMNLRWFYQSLIWLVLALAVCLPWYFQAWWFAGQPFLDRVFFENATRLSGGAGISAKPSYFYFKHLLVQLGLVSIPAFALTWAWLKSCGSGQGAFSQVSKVDRNTILIMVSWVVVPLIVFSLASGKRRGYLLTLLPPVVVLTSVFLPTYLTEFKTEKLAKPSSQLAYTLWCLIFIFLLISISGAHLPLLGETALFFNALEQACFENGLFFKFALFFSTSLLLLSSFFQLLPKLRIFSIVIPLWVVLVFILPLVMTAKSYTHSYKGFASEIIEQKQGEGSLYFMKGPLVESYESLFFYLAKPVQLAEPDRIPDAPGYYLIRFLDYQKIFSEENSKLRILARGGRLTDQPNEELVLLDNTSSLLKP